MATYICTHMRLSDGWTHIILTMQLGRDVKDVAVLLPFPPFRDGKFRGAVIKEVATQVTESFHDANLTAEALTVPVYRHKIAELATKIRNVQKDMLEECRKMALVCNSFREDVSPAGMEAFTTYQSVVRIMNSFATGIEDDEEIHPDPTPEQIAAREAREEKTRERKRLASLASNARAKERRAAARAEKEAQDAAEAAEATKTPAEGDKPAKKPRETRSDKGTKRGPIKAKVGKMIFKS